MESSKYQENIYNWVKEGQGNALVQAVAGSGKTHTILECAKLIQSNKDCSFVAFNKSIANELNTRLPPHIKARTLHSYGLSILYRNTKGLKIYNNKMDEIIQRLLSKDEEMYDNAYDFRKDFYAIKRCVSKIKNTWIDYSKIENIMQVWEENESNTPAERLVIYVRIALDESKEDLSIVDFDDMIWLPVVHELEGKEFDWVFVDEVQDLNKIQFELVKKMIGVDTRVVAVGDKSQSIYAFRGADVNSMENFKDYFDAKEMPLSICYRCPKKVIELAKTIVPEIEVFEEQIEGSIKEVGTEEILMSAKKGDMILCRTNAPLIKAVFSFIRRGIKASMVGNDIGKGLKNLVVASRARDIKTLSEKLMRNKSKYKEKIAQIETQFNLDRRERNRYFSELDKIETLEVFINESNSIQELYLNIDKIFEDRKDKGIVCSSIHKAKGLEADNVFLVNYIKMPHPMAKTDDDIQQEMNIKYVGITRSKKNLFLHMEEFEVV